MVAEKTPDPRVAVRWVTTPHGWVYVSDRGRDDPAVVLSRCPSPWCSAPTTITSASSWAAISQDCLRARICTASRTHPIGLNGISHGRWPR